MYMRQRSPRASRHQLRARCTRCDGGLAMSDRLAKIRKRFQTGYRSCALDIYNDVRWLLNLCDAARAENAELCTENERLCEESESYRVAYAQETVISARN